jgi:hypothetical protein
MTTQPIRVLLVGQGAKGSSLLLDFLEKRGCNCFLSRSISETDLLITGFTFDLVLCTDWTEGIDASIESVIGPHTTLFRCHLVEDGCWWLPIVRHGERCLGTPALRQSEFASALERVFEEIRSGTCPGQNFTKFDHKPKPGHFPGALTEKR